MQRQTGSARLHAATVQEGAIHQGPLAAKGATMPPVYAFDVNETLLDLAALDPLFGRAFGDPGAREAWFQQLIHSALVTIATGRYHQFGSIAQAALETIANRRGVTLADADRQAILQGMAQLPPHPEVPAALGRLRAAGLRVAALTNSTRMWLVAAHGWDVAGAMAAGCRGAFVARPGRLPDPVAPPPDLTGDDLEQVADQLLALHQEGTGP
jgi:2-haloacid dehalogenase